MYVIFRRYIIENIQNEIKIFVNGKVFICSICNLECGININEYQKFDFIPKEDIVVFKSNSVKELSNLITFKSTFYFCFDSSENIFNDIIVYPLNKLKVNNELIRKYDLVFYLYKYNINLKNIIIGFIELEKFIFNFIPTYFQISMFTSYPFEMFFSGYGNGITQSISYLKLKRCFKQKYKVPPPRRKKETVKLKEYQENFELNKNYNKETYEDYLDDMIVKNDAYLVNKMFFEIDIYRCYGSSFLDIYEREKLIEFKVLYDIVKRLFQITKKSKSDVVKTVCKLLVNAGCYGSLNEVKPIFFSLFPSLMIKIVKNAQEIMIKALKFINEKGLQIIYSRSDSFFLIFKNSVSEKEQNKNIHIIIDDLNKEICKEYPNSKFRLRGVYTNGVWFHLNNYVVKDYSTKKLIIKDRLKSKVWPKCIRNFGLNLVERMFKGEKKFNFKKEYRDHKKKVKISFDNFIFMKTGNFFVYVKNSKNEMSLANAMSKRVFIDVEATYSKFEVSVKKMFSKLKIF
jgi:hypothetical protein